MFNRRHISVPPHKTSSTLARLRHDLNVVMLTLGLISMGFNYAQVTGLPPFDAPVNQPALVTLNDPIFTPVAKPVSNTAKHAKRG